MRNSPRSSRFSVDVTHSGEPSTKKMRFFRGPSRSTSARLAANGEVKDSRREPRRIELAAIDGVARKLGVPLERGARHEACQLGVTGDGLEAPVARARDEHVLAHLAGREELDEARGAHGPESVPSSRLTR
jgi:hypothetical protein